MFLAPLAAGISASTLATASAAVSIGTSVLSAVSARNQASFEGELAQRNQKIAEENRLQTIRETGEAARDKDREASQELGALIASQAASGLSGGSHALQRKSLRQLAARDRERIVAEGTSQAERFRQQAQGFAGDAAAASAAKSNALTTGLLDVGSSAISGASLVQKTKANALQRKNGSL